jgi:hypothetical protein
MSRGEMWFRVGWQSTCFQPLPGKNTFSRKDDVEESTDEPVLSAARKTIILHNQTTETSRRRTNTARFTNQGVAESASPAAITIQTEVDLTLPIDRREIPTFAARVGLQSAQVAQPVHSPLG